MTPDKFRDLILERIDEKRDICLASLAQQRYRPSAVIGAQNGQPIGSVSGSTAEELALCMIDHTSRIDAFTKAREIVVEVHRAAMAPPAQEPEDEKKPQERREVY